MLTVLVAVEIDLQQKAKIIQKYFILTALVAVRIGLGLNKKKHFE